LERAKTVQVPKSNTQGYSTEGSNSQSQKGESRREQSQKERESGLPPNWEQWYSDFKKQYICLTVRQVTALKPILECLLQLEVLVGAKENLEVIIASITTQLSEPKEDH